ncbi:hypothetical protein [Flavobacterium granuli]|uniref:Uncharacterized protein n=1 Tax=Flavobacterium granuli TaxID=280093 RepID=A0ABU1S0F3_9FLAO|nr:hypothetical protein [Flavobacterium granuli]MDR6844498.1 hypothetical protein [Flavobacterium granuli]
MSSIVPITIREHLVPYFFKESEGDVFTYGNQKVKTALFSPDVSSIGKIIRMLMIKSGKPLKINNFNLCLKVSDDGNKKIYTGQFYKHESGRNSYLMLPEEANDDINDLLEDIFRMSFVSYMNGCIENNDEAVVVSAIDKWIDKYDLLEFGFSNDTFRQIFYREKKNGKIIARFQNKKSARILNFAS